MQRYGETRDLTRGVHFPNELPHLKEFPLCFAAECHWWNARVTPRANLELAGEAPGVQITCPGLAMLYEGGEYAMYTSQSQIWVKIRRTLRDLCEHGLHGHGLYAGEQVALGAVSDDHRRDPKEVRLEIPFRPIPVWNRERER